MAEPLTDTELSSWRTFIESSWALHTRLEDELRAATGLARLSCLEGRPEDAHNVLAPVYNWFTEGSETADLRDARTLLSELR